MGMNTFPAKMLGDIPTYYITDTIQEDAGGGNIRIWNYARIKGVLVPQFQCVVASTKLLTISRHINDFSKIIAHAEQVRGIGDHVH